MSGLQFSKKLGSVSRASARGGASDRIARPVPVGAGGCRGIRLSTFMTRAIGISCRSNCPA